MCIYWLIMFLVLDNSYLVPLLTFSSAHLLAPALAVVISCTQCNLSCTIPLPLPSFYPGASLLLQVTHRNSLSHSNRGANLEVWRSSHLMSYLAGVSWEMMGKYSLLRPLGRLFCGAFYGFTEGLSGVKYQMSHWWPPGKCTLFFFKYKFIYFNWRLIILQYCIGFAIHQHESATGIHVFPILNLPPTSLSVPSLWVIPVHQPQASCIMHQTWTGDSFQIWYYTCFNAILPIIPPSPSPTESKRLFYTSVSLLLSHIQGYRYHLSKLHIYVLVYCIGVFLSGLLHSV